MRVWGLWAVLLVACRGGAADNPDAGPPRYDAGPLPVDESFPPGATPVDWFTEVTAESGVTVVHEPDFSDPYFALSKANGVAVGDLNGDGRPDLVVTAGKAASSVWLNDGALSFHEVANAGIDPEHLASGVALGDLDGDGDLDAVLAGDDDARLYRGDGDGTFVEDPDSGIGVRGSAQSVHLADVDNDGLTDVIIVTYLRGDGDTTDREDPVFRNRGDGTYVDIAARLNMDVDGDTWAAGSFDYDGDLDLDLYFPEDAVTCDLFGCPADRLYRNDGLDAAGYPVFTDVSVSTEIGTNEESRNSMGLVAEDMNGDTLVDLYVSDIGGNDLLLGVGNDTFDNRTTGTDGISMGMRMDSQCAPGVDGDCELVAWGTAFADFDHDGFDDLVVVHASVLNPLYEARQPAAVWRGTGPGEFEPVQTALGWLGGHGLVANDLDGDGDLDLVVTTWDGPVRVYRNDAPDGGGAIRVALRGTTSNPDALGATVRVRLASGRRLGAPLGVGAVVHSWSMPEAHIGLGNDAIAAMQVRWPSGFVQEIDPPAAGARLELVEPALVTVSQRRAIGDGVNQTEVIATPALPDGSPAGSGLAVDITSTAGVFTGPVEDLGDGRYRRVLVAPTEPALAAITVTVEGAALLAHPRIEFR